MKLNKNVEWTYNTSFLYISFFFQCNEALAEDKFSSHLFLCLAMLRGAKCAFKQELGSLPSHFVPTWLYEYTKNGHAKQLSTGQQIYPSQTKPLRANSWPEQQREKNKNKITACILLLCWGSRLQFRASAVISAQDKSFPICLCPQMLWTGHNMLWLCIPKQCYRSSVGQSCCLEVGAQCRKAAVSVAERHQTESDVNRTW